MRLVILMIEVEQPEGISARKLLLETARHNVITAYGGNVGLALLRRFPNVDVAVVHTELADYSFDQTVRWPQSAQSSSPHHRDHAGRGPAPV